MKFYLITWENIIPSENCNRKQNVRLMVVISQMQKYKPHTKINQCLYTLKPVLRNIIIREGRIKLRNLKLKGSKNQFGEL